MLHVYPTSHMPNMRRTSYGEDEAVVEAPVDECYLCRLGVCEQTLSAESGAEAVVLHALPVQH